MITLIKFEFRKLWTPLTKVAVLALIIICILLNIAFCTSGAVAINDQGEMIIGLDVFRTIKNEAKTINGEVNQKYLDDLVNSFNQSPEKQNYEDLIGFELNKYQFPNQFINFAYYGPDTRSNHVFLDFDFIQDEALFYKHYKQSIFDVIKEENDKNWFQYSDNQLLQINEKIDELNTPMQVGYNLGLVFIEETFSLYFWLVLLVIGFSLSSLFAKDSQNGIDELSLSSKTGRDKNMNARVMAGNLFAVFIYGLFICLLFLVHGTLLSLEGWQNSIQTIKYASLYEMTVGTYLVFMIFRGLVTILLMSNLVMYLSMKFKHLKGVTLLALLTIWLLINLTNTTNALQLELNPIYYATAGIVTKFYFINQWMIPYSLMFLSVATFYYVMITILMRRQYKKYKLN